ncbi:MAG: restriction endonuclease subunit S, partial [Ruminococcus sp.]|nr:restriction endonuclease subunit S [Ruminococcus sp.]
LKAYKLSLITETVTQGLNPDVKVKDSGIEWIGKIPEHWSTSKIKYNFTIISGATPKSEKIEYWNGEINWVTPADFKTDDVYISSGKKSITKAGYDSCGVTLLPINSIIFSKRAPIGNVVISSKTLCINQGCLACISKKEISIKYFYFAISVFTDQFNMYGAGTTFKEISTKDFSNFILPLPTLKEQHKIVDYLDKKCSAINSDIEKRQALIEKLTEYKKSLIYEVVMGKKEL